MTSRSSWRVAGAVAVISALMGVGTVGCMGERAAVNRVQPDYLDKQQLIPNQYGALASGMAPGSLTPAMVRAEPQWLHQITIIAKPPTTGFSGVSSYTSVERVNFEVTENFLIARQSYDLLHDAQDCTTGAVRSPGCVGNDPHRGELIAVYRIRSHFDIRRSYNAATGEEQNIVEENSADRPWYQRRYMRVDWSANLVSGYSPLMYAGWAGRLRSEPVAEFHNLPSDPNRPLFDYGDLNGAQNVLRYFDVTNTTVLHPEETNLSSQGYPNLPLCALYDNINESCSPVRVVMRVAFRRVDPMRDYQPFALSGRDMDRFGFFEEGRRGFTGHEGGPSQAARRHHADRHNIWVQHHIRTAGNAIDHRDGDAACQADLDCNHLSPTSRCDMVTHTCGDIYERCAPARGAGTPEDRTRTADLLCAPADRPERFGSTCDLDIAYTRGDRWGLCTVPLRQRDVRPVAYHLSENFPDRMMPVTNTIVRDWNRVFSHAVREARYRECILDPATAGNVASCQFWRNMDMRGTGPDAERAQQGRFVWVGCHNPVWGTTQGQPGFHPPAEVTAAQADGWDAPSCGPQGTSARLGDIRYSMIASINEYDMQGPWGLAGISGDPVTGEVVSARGSVWQTVTDTQAAYATDMMRILNGNLEADRFSLGDAVRDAYDYIRSVGGREERTAGHLPLHPRPVHRDITDQAELQNMLNATAFDSQNTSLSSASNPDQVAGLDMQEMLGRASRVTQEVDTTDIQNSSGQPAVRNVRVSNDRNLMSSLGQDLDRSLVPHESSESRRSRLRGSSIESRMMNREVVAAAGYDPGTEPTGEALEGASPLRRNSTQFHALRSAFRATIEAHQCNYDSANAFADDVITVMLRRFRRNVVPEDVRFGLTWDFHMPGSPATCSDEPTGMSDPCQLNYAEIERYLQQYIQYGVMLHELGHSVGERHNFSGSADSMNYFDEYWQLRGYAGVAAGAPAVSADMIRPRWEHQARGLPFYGATEEDLGVEEYAYSSVMDYIGWNQDAHGLGRYDRAFVLNGYVRMTEAFRTVGNRDDLLNASDAMSGGYEGAVRLTFTGNPMNPTPTSFHYTDIPRLVGTVMAPDIAHPGQMVSVPNTRDSNRFPVFLHETVRAPYNAVGWDPEHTNLSNGGPNGERAEHVVVPFRFGTDDWANYVWNAQRYDAGADMYESMRYMAAHYLDYYFSTAFARGRSTFTLNAYTARIRSRYLDQMYYSMRNYMYLDRIYRDYYAPIPTFQTFLNSNTVIAGRLGATTIIDTLANAVMMPQAGVIFSQSGTHYLVRRYSDNTEVWQRDRSSGVLVSPTAINVPAGMGREFSSYYDFNSGFWWRENVISAGGYHDKRISMSYLTDTYLYTPGRSVIEYNDVHNLQINMYTMFPGQTMRWFGSLLSRDHADVAPQIRPRTGNEPQIFRTQISLLNLPDGTGMGRNGRDPMLRSIDPNLGPTVEFETASYLFTNLSGTFDRTEMLSARMWAEGDTWALPATATRTLVTFTDPFTGLVYSAPHIGGAPGEAGERVGLSRRDAASNETGIAARMLGYANMLATAARNAPPARQFQANRDLQIYIDALNIFRDLNRRFNTGVDR